MVSKQNLRDNAWKVCPECGVIVHNLRKHISRDRCKVQHIRKDVRDMAKRLSLSPLDLIKKDRRKKVVSHLSNGKMTSHMVE